MAMVPDQFVPSATTSPLGINPVSAQGVQPMRNAAPEQMMQAGAVVSKLGEQTQDIGERIQNQLDDAMAKQAETGFLKSVLDITNGDGKNPGYLNTKGQDAINGYSDAAAAIAKAKQAGLDGLANDFQKSMYNRVASQHMLSFGREMADHRFQQTAQYSGESAINRANSYATTAANAVSSYGQTDADGNQTGEFFKNMKTAEQETLAGVQIMKGAPAGSDIANAALLQLHTQIGTGALSQMMDSRQPYSKVQAVFEDMKAKGMLDIRATDTLGKMVKSYSDQESIRVAVNDNLSDAARRALNQPTSSTGTPDYQFAIKGATITSNSYDPEQGGVQVSIPQGSNIQAPADGKVTIVGRDENDNFKIGIEHADGSVTSFTGLKSANVKVGDHVERGEDVATSGTLDNKPSVMWSLTNKDGQNVDPTKAGLAPIDLTKITSEKVLGDALVSLRNQVTDPYLQQQATNEMESMVRHNQQMHSAMDRQNTQMASDAFYSNGMKWRAIPPTLFTQLSPETQQKFKDLQDNPVGEDHTDTVAGFILHPDTLTVPNVQAARTRLTNSSYLSLLGKAQELATNPKGVQEATGIAERIQYFATQAGVKTSDDGTMSPADKRTYTALQFKIQQDIDRLKKQNNGKATAEQVDSVIKNELTQRTLSIPRSAWNPLAIIGYPNQETKKFNFEMPSGATHVVPGSDGHLHYTDGKSDLGLVN